MKMLFSMLLFAISLSAVAAEVVPFTAQQRQSMNIETAPMQAAGTRASTNLPGKVTVPNAQLHIVTATQQGLVETLLVAEGEVVKKGQVLAKIKSPALLALQGEYLEAYTRYQLAKSNYDRDQQLQKEGIIAERRLLESKARYQELLTTVSRLKQMLGLSGMDQESLAALKTHRKLDSSLVVTAPFDGVLLEQLTTAGNRVEAADPLYKIASLKPLWLEVHVPLEKLANIQLGQTVTAPSAKISGSVITIGKMVHGVDQGVLVRAEINEGAETLRPGQFLQVQLSVASAVNNYRVPRSAVIHSAGKSYIFSAQADGFLPVEISVMGDEANALIIETELPVDTQIVVVGTSALKAAWLGGE